MRQNAPPSLKAIAIKSFLDKAMSRIKVPSAPMCYVSELNEPLWHEHMRAHVLAFLEQAPQRPPMRVREAIMASIQDSPYGKKPRAFGSSWYAAIFEARCLSGRVDPADLEAYLDSGQPIPRWQVFKRLCDYGHLALAKSLFEGLSITEKVRCFKENAPTHYLGVKVLAGARDLVAWLCELARDHGMLDDVLDQAFPELGCDEDFDGVGPSFNLDAARHVLSLMNEKARTASLTYLIQSILDDVSPEMIPQKSAWLEALWAMASPAVKAAVDLVGVVPMLSFCRQPLFCYQQLCLDPAVDRRKVIEDLLTGSDNMDYSQPGFLDWLLGQARRLALSDEVIAGVGEYCFKGNYLERALEPISAPLFSEDVIGMMKTMASYEVMDSAWYMALMRKLLGASPSEISVAQPTVVLQHCLVHGGLVSADVRPSLLTAFASLSDDYDDCMASTAVKLFNWFVDDYCGDRRIVWTLDEMREAFDAACLSGHLPIALAILNRHATEAQKALLLGDGRSRKLFCSFMNLAPKALQDLAERAADLGCLETLLTWSDTVQYFHGDSNAAFTLHRIAPKLSKDQVQHLIPKAEDFVAIVSESFWIPDRQIVLYWSLSQGTIPLDVLLATQSALFKKRRFTTALLDCLCEHSTPWSDASRVALFKEAFEVFRDDLKKCYSLNMSNQDALYVLWSYANTYLPESARPAFSARMCVCLGINPDSPLFSCMDDPRSVVGILEDCEDVLALPCETPVVAYLPVLSDMINGLDQDTVPIGVRMWADGERKRKDASCDDGVDGKRARWASPSML